MSFRWAAGNEVVLWEGAYVAEEATWSFAAVIFYDPVKERLRMFTFNDGSQRHLGILQKSGPGKLAWNLSGLRADGTKERFVVEFVPKGKDRLLFNLRDRRPGDGSIEGNLTTELRRVVEPVKEGSP
jgi:hypothetical protein